MVQGSQGLGYGAFGFGFRVSLSIAGLDCGFSGSMYHARDALEVRLLDEELGGAHRFARLVDHLVPVLFVGILIHAAYALYTVYRQSSIGPVDPLLRALSGRLRFTVRRHTLNEYSLFMEETSEETSLPTALTLDRSHPTNHRK